MRKTFPEIEPERRKLAEKRLYSILGRHGIAVARTIEQKISDAGPFNQRIHPHVLTTVRNELVKVNQIKLLHRQNAPWFYLPDTPVDIVHARLKEQLPIFKALQHGLRGRIGQVLEIAIYRALLQQDALDFLGGFSDLDEHDDSTLYSKEEPRATLSGRRLPGKQSLDFLARHRDAGWAGIEAKNVREWFYPDREEIFEFLRKCLILDCVPVLIARRIPFVTFKIFSQCGVVFHQTYNQLFPFSDRELAEKARHKNLLGYHDIRIGNAPDKRLLKFVSENLPRVLPDARALFDEFRDLLEGYVFRDMEYQEFTARVRRRSAGTYEDGDWDPPEDHF